MKRITPIREGTEFVFSIDGNVDRKYAISASTIEDFMSYAYIMTIDELGDELTFRLGGNKLLSHSDVYAYVMRNFELGTFEDDGLELRGYDYATQVIPKIVDGDSKQSLHRKALYEGVKFFFQNTRFKNGEVLFTGGSSLLIKSELDGLRHYRFSLDIDFSYYHSELDESLLKGEIIATADHVISVLQNGGAVVHEGSDWKLITFDYPGYGVAEIKVDWMHNYNMDVETLIVDGVRILKASDHDIIANKLNRMNERDRKDVEFLEKNVSIDSVIESLKKKSVAKYGDELSFYSRIKPILQKNSDIRTVRQVLTAFEDEGN